MNHPLSKYVDDILRPRTPDIQQLNARINAMVNVIRNNSKLSLHEIRRGGSFEKGTMLRHRIEADVVLVFNKEKGKSLNWRALMDHVFRDLISAFPEAQIQKGQNVAIHLMFKNKDAHEVAIDVVPSLWVNSPLQMAEVRNSKIYQGITTVWHVEYIKRMKQLRPRFCDVVMLLKDWKDENSVPLKSFHLEFLAASALEYRSDEANDIESLLDACFREIQGFATGTYVCPVEWPYFEEQHIPDNFPELCVLVDPANPIDNLTSHLTSKEIKAIKSEASRAAWLIKEKRYTELFDPDNKLKYGF